LRPRPCAGGDAHLRPCRCAAIFGTLQLRPAPLRRAPLLIKYAYTKTVCSAKVSTYLAPKKPVLVYKKVIFIELIIGITVTYIHIKD
jgi:hypothetical protein